MILHSATCYFKDFIFLKKYFPLTGQFIRNSNLEIDITLLITSVTVFIHVQIHELKPKNNSKITRGPIVNWCISA